MDFGEKLRYVRKELLRMTETEFASSIGANQATINAVESGQNKNLSFSLFKQLVKVHRINPMYFINDGTEDAPILPIETNELAALKQKVAAYEGLLKEFNRIKEGRKPKQASIFENMESLKTVIRQEGNKV